MYRVVAAVILLFLVSCSRKTTPAAEKPLWQNVVSTTSVAACPGKTFPLRYRLLEVNYTDLRKLLLGNDASGGRHDTLEIRIPMPDGTDPLFRVFPVHIMPDALSQKYPGIATYSGFRADAPAETIRLDISPAGFHAMILRPEGSAYVDPYCPGDSVHVISYLKKDMPEGSKLPFEEVIPGDGQ